MTLLEVGNVLALLPFANAGEVQYEMTSLHCRHGGSHRVIFVLEHSHTPAQQHSIITVKKHPPFDIGVTFDNIAAVFR